MNTPMGFVIFFAFSIPFSSLENHVMHPLSGNQYTISRLRVLFWPVAAIHKDRTIPANLQFSIHYILTHHFIINSNMEDKNGNPFYIVSKYSNTTKFTLGYYSGMDTYIYTDFGLECREVVVYNYSKTHG